MSKRTEASAATPAIAVVQTAGVLHTVHRYDAGTTGEGHGTEAATVLGIDEAFVHKTLVAGTSDGRLVVAVVPVSGRLDLRALAVAVGARRAGMADPAAAERATGYVVGAISPLGQRRRLPTMVDEGALHHRTIFVSAGRRGLELELDPNDLVRLAGAAVASIAC